MVCAFVGAQRGPHPQGGEVSSCRRVQRVTLQVGGGEGLGVCSHCESGHPVNRGRIAQLTPAWALVCPWTSMSLRSPRVLGFQTQLELLPGQQEPRQEPGLWLQHKLCSCQGLLAHWPPQPASTPPAAGLALGLLQDPQCQMRGQALPATAAQTHTANSSLDILLAKSTLSRPEPHGLTQQSHLLLTLGAPGPVSARTLRNTVGGGRLVLFIKHNESPLKCRND